MTSYDFFRKLKNGLHKIPEFFIKKSFGKCGKNCHIARGCKFEGIKNIYLGDNVTFNYNAMLLTTTTFGANIT